MNKLLIVLALLCLCQIKWQTAKAQYTLSGYVQDQKSLEKIPNVTILLPYEEKITTTNNYGFFSITIASDTATVIIKTIGYYAKDTLLNFNESNLITISLAPLPKYTDDVIVKGKRNLRIEQQTQMSKISIPVEQIKSLPRFLGEVDVLKALQLLPGVSQGAEGTSGILVRGGTPDQNLFLLDGTPVYNTSHLFGIFSVFNADAIKSVDLYKGGFPARFGGRLSSVIDLVLKDGNKNEYHGEYSGGLISSRGTFEGPIKKGKSSFIVSGRRTYLDVLAAPFIKSAETGIQGLGAYFYDLNAKVNFELSPKDKIYFSWFSGQDFLKIRVKDLDNNDFIRSKLRFGWGNLLGTARWNHVFNKKLFANTLLNFTKYRFLTDVTLSEKFGTNTTSFRAKYFSGIYDLGAKMDFDYRPNSNQNIRFGAAITQHVFSPGATTIKLVNNGNSDIDTALNTTNQRSLEASIYAEDDWQISKELKVNIGVHASVFKAKTKWYPNIQPRLNARYLLPNNWAIKGSYTHMYQFIHLLTNNTTTLPTDLWVPSTDKVKPQFSQQGAIGIAKTLFDNQYEFSVEGYYKTMDGIIEYKDGATFLNTRSENWDTKVESGKGKAYGAEVFLQRKQGKVTGWIGYTLSWSKRQFDNVNFGKEFFFKYDRRHDLELAIIFKAGKGWEIGGNWQYTSPTPFTLPIAQYTSQLLDPAAINYSNFTSVDYFGSRNNIRLLPYHRMDISFTHKKQKKKYERTWNISVYNMYNRQNPFFYEFDRDGNNANGNRAKLDGYTLLPIIPNISWGIKF
jgi:hypothetical protein